LKDPSNVAFYFVVLQEDITSETLQEQFSIVKKETNTSHVQEFGDMVCDLLVIPNFS
jgi:legumain